MTEAAEASTADILNEIRGHISGPGTRCMAGDFLPTLSPERRNAITAAIAERIPLAAIGRTLKAWGYTGTSASAARHLAERCSCLTR